ncbi:TPA: hypothetical protein DCE37_08595 [Candidatus Latescibacteria bacterium]|nr:hypothetical protein [Candidatus Latescibacterota bacterium]
MVSLRILVGVVCLSLVSVPVQAMTVQLSADRTRVGVGEVFSLTVAMSIEEVAVPTPDLTLPDAFDLIGSRSSTSTSISIVQGAVSQTKTVNVVNSVRAKEEGTFTIGPASVVSNGQTIRSQAIQVEVVKGAAAPRASSPLSGQDAVTADQLQEIEENLFIEVSADRESVYIGEQIVLTYDLYSRYRIQNPRFGVVPSYTGFWAEKIFDASRLEQRSEVVNGRSFNRSRLKQVALFPTVPGKQKIEQLEFVCDIPLRSRRRSLFDVDDFFSWDPFRSRQVTIRATDIELDIKPLPGNVAASFCGGVGRFDIEAVTSSEMATQGDPVTVTIIVKGRGNLHGVGEPRRPDTQSFKFYDPKSTVETRLNGTVLEGEKTFEYVVIPVESGTVELPPFELAYFDPDRKRYVTARSQPVLLSVAPGEQVEEVSMSAPSGRAVELMAQDIRHIKPDARSLEPQGAYLYQSSTIWGLNALPLLVLGVAIAWRQRQERLDVDVAYARKRRSRGEARKRLDQAREAKSGGSAEFHSEIRQAIAGFLSDRLNLESGELTEGDARRHLAERGAAAEMVDEVAAILQVCDFARFAPGENSQSDREALLVRAETAIEGLEGSL